MKKQRAQPAFPPDVVTTIGTETVLSGGTLRVEHDLRVEGQLQCDVQVDGHVYIAEQASIIGHVQAKSMHILGSLTGSAHVQESVRLCAEARVRGDVHAGTLAIEAGAQLEGQVSMQGAPKRQRAGQGDGQRKRVEVSDMQLAISGDGMLAAASMGDGTSAGAGAVALDKPPAAAPALAYEPPSEVRDDTDAFMQFAPETPPPPVSRAPRPAPEPASLPTEGWDDWAEPNAEADEDGGVDRFW
ncbi:MAG: polymer-forming cytoskeletal protein [Bacteroidota bacterium]